MEVKKRAEIIQKWIDDYCNSVSFELKSLVVGVSGGVIHRCEYTLCFNWKKNYCFKYAN